MQCASCGADLTPNKKFCEKCVKRRICSKCSNDVELTELYCTDCGSRVEEEKKIICQGKKTDSANCNSELSDSARFCSECGTERATYDTLDDGKEDKNKITDIVEENPVKEEENKKPEHPAVYKPDLEKSEKPSDKQVKEQKRGLTVICTHSKFFNEKKALSSRPNASDDLYMMKTLWELYGCQVISCSDETNEFYNNHLIRKIEAELENLPDVKMFVFVLSTRGEEREEKILRKKDKRYEHYFYTKDGDCSTQDLMNKIANIQKLDNKLKLFIIQACKSRTSGENEDQGCELETIGKQVQSQDIPQQGGTDERDAIGIMPPPEEDEQVKVQLSGERKSRASDENEDQGHEPETIGKQVHSQDIPQQDGMDERNAIATMPLPEEDKKVIVQLPSERKSRASDENKDQEHEFETVCKQVQSQDIPQQDGTDEKNAIATMHPPEEDEIVIVQLPSECMSHACSAMPVPQSSQPEITTDSEKGTAAPTSEEGDTNDDEKDHTIQPLPHCDDCIVMFASMSGKFAYRKINSELSGGWLIKAIEDVFKQHKGKEKVDILDMLTEVNREVGQKYTERKNQEIIPKMIVSEEGSKEELQKQLRTHMNSLKLLQENNSSRVKIRGCKDDLNLLDARINQADTKDSLLKLKEEVLTLTQKIAYELRTVTLKAQSNFFHNLAFDEEKLYLYKNKSEIHKIVKPVITGRCFCIYLFVLFLLMLVYLFSFC